MWKKTTRDCILSRWSISQRSKQLRVSQKMDVDLYENSCFGERKSTVYATSDQTMSRTTTGPDSREGKEATTITPIPKLDKEETDFRRFRAHHTRSLSAAPLPQQAFHRVDGESSLPPQAKTKRSQQNKPHLSNSDKVVISAQLDETYWIQKFVNKPIRKGKIVPHTPSAQELPLESTTTTSAIPHSFVTPSRPSPCFGRIRNHYLPNFVEKTLTGVNVRQCLLSCLNATTFFCASVHYQDSRRLCTLNGGNVHLNKARIVERNGFDYFENKCNLGDRDDQLEATTPVPRKATKGDSCFVEKRDTVLASLDAMVVEHLETLEECTAACSTGPVTCTALNWIPATNGCMLFQGEIDNTQLTEGPGSSFFTNNCSGRVGAKSRSQKERNDDYYDHDST